MGFWERSENWPECTQIIHWKMQVTKGNLNFTCLENALFESVLRTKYVDMAGTPLPCLQTVVSLWRAGEKPLQRTFASLIEPPSSAKDECIKQVKALVPPQHNPAENLLSLLVYVLHKTQNFTFLRRSRAKTAKKCTKKGDACAKLLFSLLTLFRPERGGALILGTFLAKK